MIKIEQPRIAIDGQSACLEAYVSIDSKRDEIWFRVDKRYEDYLCFERSDAYVVAVLHYAISNGHDIKCEAPISEYLYYNIEKYLIPAIVSYNPTLHTPKITASIASDTLPNAGAVGTGISCGVDSLHAMSNQTNLKFKNHNITHLCFNNVGSHGEGERAKELYRKRLDRPRQFAEEYEYTFVASDSNLMDVVKQNHFMTHTFSSMFAVFCLQKLYAVYYYASAGYKYHEFTFVIDPKRSSGSFEFALLPLFSSPSLRLYSEGENMSRLQKMAEIVKYEPSYKYLNVCLTDGDNCGKCEKCVRTMLGLDALGALEKYSNVFDVDYYKKNKKWYLKQLLLWTAFYKHDYIELYPFFKKEITFSVRVSALFLLLKLKIWKMLEKMGILKYVRPNNSEV